MNIQEVMEALEKGKIIKVEKLRNDTIEYWIKVTILPLNITEIFSLEADRDFPNPKSFSEVDYGTYTSINLRTLKYTKFSIVTQDQVLKEIQQMSGDES